MQAPLLGPEISAPEQYENCKAFFCESVKHRRWNGSVSALLVPALGRDTPGAILLDEQERLDSAFGRSPLFSLLADSKSDRDIAMVFDFNPQERLFEYGQSGACRRFHTLHEVRDGHRIEWSRRRKEQRIGHEIGRECVPSRVLVRAPTETLELPGNQVPDRPLVILLIHITH
ncbi:MAG: hypothetical protein HLUCCO07_16495 [Rhodobacteraceae bacterium HLUCCO07]|nr:MAG: hypothetical protein HLUCCO07_16495 [Rhodobacteraceae bacterium HLUCCO07]